MLRTREINAHTLHSQKRHRIVASCQFYRLVATCQQVATSLSILSSCNRSVEIRLVATCHLQTCYNLSKQLATSLLITTLDNQLATSLLTNCNRLVANKLSQAMRTHPDIGLLQQVVVRCQQTRCNLRVFGCVRVITQKTVFRFCSSCCCYGITYIF